MYTPTFFPSGLLNLPLERSIRHDVKIFWIVSAVLSTIDFLSSSPAAAVRILLVRSGRLLRVMTSLDRDSEMEMLVLSIMEPYVGLDSAVAHDLFLISWCDRGASAM